MQRFPYPLLRAASSLSSFALGLSLLMPAASAQGPGQPDPSEPTATPSPGTILIVIDPGHGGPFSNANANGLREKHVNLRIALALRDQLAARGFQVMMTRETDRAVNLTDRTAWAYASRRGLWRLRRDGVANPRSLPVDDLQARVEIANRAGADLFICVHANGARRRSVRGYETFASARDALGLELARSVQRNVVRETGLVDRGAKTADFYVLRWTDMPAILIEAAFISNPKDAALLKQPRFRSRIASGVASGVEEWMRTGPYRGAYPRFRSEEGLFAYAATVARSHPATSARTVVIAREDLWEHSVGAASLAATMDAPLLWAAGPNLDTTLAATLAELKPERIVLTGTDADVGERAVAEVAEAARVSVSKVGFVAASTPAALSVSIAESIGVGPNGLVFVASSREPFALMAAGATAAAMRSPLLVASESALPDEARVFLDSHSAEVRRVVLVGSEAAVPPSLAGAWPSVRHTGGDTASVAASLARAFPMSRAARGMRPLVADGRHGPEYLVAAARAASLRQPLIPVSGRVLPARTREWITNRRPAITGFEIHDARGQIPLLIDQMLRKAER